MYRLTAAAGTDNPSPLEKEGEIVGVAGAFFIGAQIGVYLVAASVGIANSTAYQEWQAKKAQEQTQDVHMYASADGITTSADVPEIAVVTPEK